MPVTRGRPAARASVAELRRRAEASRARSRSLREESERERERAGALAGAVVERLLRCPLPAGDEGTVFALRLAGIPAAVRLARHRLHCWLERAGVAPGDAFDVVLACSEACANAVEHPVRPARHAFEVEARRAGGTIELVVRDFGRWSAQRRTPVRGRGLGMIRALMDTVEVATSAAGGTIVMRRVERGEGAAGRAPGAPAA